MLRRDFEPAWANGLETEITWAEDPKFLYFKSEGRRCRGMEGPDNRAQKLNGYEPTGNMPIRNLLIYLDYVRNSSFRMTLFSHDFGLKT